MDWSTQISKKKATKIENDTLIRAKDVPTMKFLLEGDAYLSYIYYSSHIFITIIDTNKL